MGGALAPILFWCASAAGVDDSSLAQCAAVSDAAARLACYDALAGRAPAPSAPVASTPPAAPAPSADFGKPEAKETPSLKARVVGTLKQWEPGLVVKLDNGQTWRVTGEESGYYPNVPENPEVVITKTMFGSYRMEIVAIGRSIKVKRIS